MKSLLNSKAEWSTYLPFWCWQWVSAGSNWARNASHGHHLTGTVTKGGGGPKQSPVNQCLAEFSRYPWLQSHPPIPRYPWIPPHIFRHPGFPGGPAGKESGCKAGVLGSIPGLGRSPGERKGYPLHYSDLENSKDCIVHGVTKSQTWLSDFHFTHSVLKFLSSPHHRILVERKTLRTDTCSIGWTSETSLPFTCLQSKELMVCSALS